MDNPLDILARIVQGLCGLLLRILASLSPWRRQPHKAWPSDTGNLLHASLDGKPGTQHPIAVIIPTMNEAAVLAQTITRIFDACTLSPALGKPAVVVVDAGVTSETESCLEPLMASHPNISLFTLPFPSRGAQQNFGARHAKAPVLLFLHADTMLPAGWDSTVLACLSSRVAPTIGAFSLSLPSPISTSLRVMLHGANIRARYGGLPYGDQVYFLTRMTFDFIGGFPDVPIMEDVGLLRNIRKAGGHVSVLPDKVVTSPRRWVKNGVIWNTVLNQLFMSAWICGASDFALTTIMQGSLEPGEHSLLLFARFPSPGTCKTRLMPRLGELGASSFCLAALKDNLHLFSHLPGRKVLCYTPTSAAENVRSLLEEEHLASLWDMQPQARVADLGARLAAGLEQARHDAAESLYRSRSVTFIGMDCFELTPSRILNAASSVSEDKAYMLPARDGGYVLLTLPLTCPTSAFEGIPWSCDRTGEAQIAKLKDIGLACTLGEELGDVDEPQDLDVLWETRDRVRDAYPRTIGFLESLMSASGEQAT